ncbi:MAG: ribose transport system permease protein [Chloroflexota bacterium]|jgi:ribose/xylose/arabinose/galactoside ABC-type transport system permease subunit|nr:ribose transport system permease protein [Chloroflexota bacterium]
MSSDIKPLEPATGPALQDRLRLAGTSLARIGGLLIAVLLIGGAFAVLSEGRFIGIANLLGLLRAMSTIAIVGMGLTMVIVVGEIDLSFGALYGLCATVMAVSWMQGGFSVFAAIVLAFAVAIAVGLFNGFFTTVVKVPSFIATLGASTLIFGFTLFLGKTQTYNPAYPVTGRALDPAELAFFTGLSNQSLPFGVPMQGLWMLGAAVLFSFLLGRSLFGFRLKAIGGNPQAAVLARLPVRRYKFLAFILCGLMACLAAVLDFAFVGSASPSGGQSLLFPVFAAVIIGGASLSGGRGTIIGTLLGALLLAILTNGLAVLRADTFAQQMLLGTVTIGAVVLDQVTRRFAR